MHPRKRRLMKERARAARVAAVPVEEPVVEEIPEVEEVVEEPVVEEIPEVEEVVEEPVAEEVPVSKKASRKVSKSKRKA